MLGSMARAAGRAAGQRARGRVRGRGRGRAGRGNQGGMLATGRGRAVRGGPRPQRGRGIGTGILAGRPKRAVRQAQLASNRAATAGAMGGLLGGNQSVGAIGPRLFNPSRPVNARLLGGIGPSRAVNPAARQRQLQGMGNLQRLRPINPNQSAAQFLGISARPMNPRAAMGSLFGRPAFGRPRGPQMVRRARGRGRGLRGLFG